MKKIIIICLLFIDITTNVYAINIINKDEQKNNTNNINMLYWQKEAPQLFNNDIYLELKKSAPTIYRSESTTKLIGSITNPFGIRDDILEHIIKTIPSNNESAMRAAIKMSQYRQQIYYGNLNESEIVLIDSKEILAGSCLVQYLHGASSNDVMQDVKYVSSLRKQMRNTKARDEHMWDIDRKYFSWKVSGTGLNTYEEKLACENGRF